VWTFIVKETTLKMDSTQLKTDRIKIVAMNSKKPGEA
jgi:hypothetical protein